MALPPEPAAGAAAGPRAAAEGHAGSVGRFGFLVGLGLALLVGGALRAPAIVAGYPYLQYVDEGHVLHPVLATVRQGRWEPSQNNYPALPILAIAGAARAASPLLPGLDWRLSPTAPAGRSYYDIVDPPEVILVARVLGWLLSLATIVGCGLLAARLAGPTAGIAAAAAAALVPALVARGSFVMVDTYATLFVVGACLFAAAAERPEQLVRAASAGACAGWAAVSKYPAGLVGLAVVAAFALAPWPLRARLRAVATAAAAGGIGAVLGMPALLRDPRGVWDRMRWQARQYSRETQTYVEQVFDRAEWDVPLEAPELGLAFVLAALAGLATLLARRRSRRHALGHLLFATLLVGIHAGYAFQAFRNLLPVAALGCVWVGCGAGWAGERLRRGWLATAVACAALALLFLPADLRFARQRAVVVDSRRQAVDWLAGQGERSRKLLQAEVPFHPREVSRLARARVAPLGAIVAAAEQRGPRWLVLGELWNRGGEPFASPEQLAILAGGYVPRATFGHEGRTVRPGFERGNALRVTVWERRRGARARAVPGPSSPPRASGASAAPR